MSMALLGVVSFVFGSIRDFAAYGIARIAVYGSLTISYILLALAPSYPRIKSANFTTSSFSCNIRGVTKMLNSNSSLVFIFILHAGAGSSLSLISLQFTLLSPDLSKMLVGMASGLVTAR